MAEIPSRPAGTPPEELQHLLDGAGCLVVTDVLDAGARESLRKELAPYMAATPVGEDDPEAFYPGHTRRITGLAARSETARGMLQHPIALEMCNRFLLPNCERYHVHVTAGLEIGPGAREQILHREEDPFSFFSLPRPSMIVATMWAISDFTAENGGTLLVPGSHRWGANRKAERDEVVSAEMPAGSMLFWLGGLLHAGGANTTAEQWRYGVILTYSLGWLRQEENQFLDVPQNVASALSPELRALLGYEMHGALGFYDPRVAAAFDAS